MLNMKKGFIGLAATLAIVMGTLPTAGAMHIMEGYLPVGSSLVWFLVCLPFLIRGLFSIKTIVEHDRRAITLLAMSGAFIFVISSLKIPSVTGSCSHMTGTGLGAILFGPWVVSILGIIVLLFQAILLAHGGLTTLGANTFSMAIAGPLMSFGIYKLCQKLRVNKKVGIFLSALLGGMLTYCVTGIQLGLAYPAAQGGALRSVREFLLLFAPTQLPLAVIEGLLTVVVMIALESYARPELRAIGFEKGVV